MEPRMLSAVIAVRDEEEGLARTLASLIPAVAEGVLRDASILDSGGLTGIATIADAAGCRRFEGDVGETLPHALSAARGQWVLALRPGVVLEAGWFREAAEFVERAASMDKPPCAAFSHASLRYGPVARLAEGWRFAMGNLFGAVRPDQGLIVSKQRLRESPAASLPPRPRGRVVILRAKAFTP